MCILFATRSHKEYELILISNRDEYLGRKTHETCWHNDNFILSPYDMSREENHGNKIFGTWLGMNKKGKIATILNLRRFSSIDLKELVKPRSRGLIPFTFLYSDWTNEDSFEEWETFEKFKSKYPFLQSSGDFNFFYGDIKEGNYRIIDSLGNTFKVLDNNNRNMIISNDLYQHKDEYEGKPTWGKIKIGAERLNKFLKETERSNEDEVLAKCFELASYCSIDSSITREENPNKELAAETIYVPPLKVCPDEDIGLTKTNGKYYGTRTQIVVLVHKDRKHVTLVEHTIHNSDEEIYKYSGLNPKEVQRLDFTIT
ncbi:hypothetical protein KAFR_0C01930 [Kazachstania africana CBS 2517]|uniref:Transport and Golgi organization protein 2 n=1 Tax=Kazachstania africana (strain ATCC 22294 / BCRC 22015 / CBS 2517 / CECT 1963 / NBRC 1671 / NRRL Y-8276) TaxID=1071382 RepID=H2AS36_KAZAF|nr:hypothetical protein KAFR_0C01930 [Kazachstania africana CBS 2517]CCF57186.1 hypothetical protein KAFR_0C01930 [Kazachstania africana CBS 2517]